MRAIVRKNRRINACLPNCRSCNSILQRVNRAQRRDYIVLADQRGPRRIDLLRSPENKIQSQQLINSPRVTLTLLNSRALQNDRTSQQQLYRFCARDPLTLGVITTSVRALFRKSVTTFLTMSALIFGDVHHLLSRRFRQLSPLRAYLVV